jgi:hypothetical protein
MTTHDAPSPTNYAAAELGLDLDKAQKDKARAQMPAVRRLRFVTRIFFVLGVIGALLNMLALGWAQKLAWTATQLRGSNLDLVAFVVFTAVLYVNSALQVFVLALYWRFGKQLRRDQVEQLVETATAIERTWRWALSVTAVGSAVAIFNQRALLAVAIGSSSAVAIFDQRLLLAIAIGPSALALVLVLIMFLVMRQYVRTALKELPRLIAAAGADSPKGDYVTLNKALGMSFVVAAAMMVLGYLTIGALSQWLTSLHLAT